MAPPPPHGSMALKLLHYLQFKACVQVIVKGTTYHQLMVFGKQFCKHLHFSFPLVYLVLRHKSGFIDFECYAQFTCFNNAIWIQYLHFYYQNNKKARHISVLSVFFKQVFFSVNLHQIFVFLSQYFVVTKSPTTFLETE